MKTLGFACVGIFDTLYVAVYTTFTAVPPPPLVSIWFNLVHKSIWLIK